MCEAVTYNMMVKNSPPRLIIRLCQYPDSTSDPSYLINEFGVALNLSRHLYCQLLIRINDRLHPEDEGWLCMYFTSYIRPVDKWPIMGGLSESSRILVLDTSDMSFFPTYGKNYNRKLGNYGIIILGLP